MEKGKKKREESEKNKKTNPKRKKGKSIRTLKKKAPQVAKRMGYKKGMKVR